MAEQARVEFVRACQRNEALRSMRRIEAGIDGTETEKGFIARFRAATSFDEDGGGGGMAQLYNVTAFWSRVAPSTNLQDEAVKHAVVALSAAFQLCQYPDEPVIHGFTRDSLDVFVIQHYNNSIERLQRHVDSSSPESVRVTLLCCLAFISLETLRGNHAVAVSHLVNGLRILQSLPDSTFACLTDPANLIWPPDRDGLQMPDIIRLFARFEMLACFFTRGDPARHLGARIQRAAARRRLGRGPVRRHCPCPQGDVLFPARRHGAPPRDSRGPGRCRRPLLVPPNAAATTSMSAGP
ncbi:hypothetical protein VTK26DRAFT_8063 [Humicola hyalothermophila]